MSKMTKAVAAAVLTMGASAAQAGITIPAGDWTVDIGGNVNAYYTNVDSETTARVGGVRTKVNSPDANVIGTGLLPAALGIGAKTRQNDLDIAFQFSFFTGTSAGGSGGNDTNEASAAAGALGGNTLNIRQAYLTFGDKSWGTIKAGRDIGIFGSDAILSDMTLLGVGNGTPGGSSTLGRIGSGYIYADWKGQISYASPNWNGFSFNVGVMEGWTNGVATHDSNDMAYEGKAAYEWGGDVSGKAWVGFLSQKHDGTAANFDSYTSRGWDIGAKVNVAGFGLVGYYYDGRGLDSQATNGTLTSAANGTAAGGINGTGGLQFLGGQKTDDNGGYVQATWTAPFGTKFGASWGVNNSESNHRSAAADARNFDAENETWVVGVYHPLTKSLNLVAEYTDQDKDIDRNTAAGKDTLNIENQQIAIGAILFF